MLISKAEDYLWEEMSAKDVCSLEVMFCRESLRGVKAGNAAS